MDAFTSVPCAVSRPTISKWWVRPPTVAALVLATVTPVGAASPTLEPAAMSIPVKQNIVAQRTACVSRQQLERFQATLDMG